MNLRLPHAARRVPPDAYDDWALRPVNMILCDERQFGRHEWVTTMCAFSQPTRRPGIHAEAFRQIRLPTRALIAAPGPRLASLRSGVVVTWKNPEIGALDTTAVMGVPFSGPSLTAYPLARQGAGKTESRRRLLRPRKYDTSTAGTLSISSGG